MTSQTCFAIRPFRPGPEGSANEHEHWLNTVVRHDENIAITKRDDLSLYLLSSASSESDTDADWCRSKLDFDCARSRVLLML